eukprot:TRINITY_DN3803_c0_g1_i5.p1 TRINITY_DN3803_c0_g1~~TRINITY_DN3803_c0_g1_i5.p1  ORF type:complete len:147 (-),score=16.77 TRINITY_DN3803_c0_g1_i5:288-728(-)
MSDVVRGPTESAFNDETQSYDSVCEYTKLIEQEIQLEERKHQLMLESLHAARTISHQQEQILSKLTSQLAKNNSDLYSKEVHCELLSTEVYRLDQNLEQTNYDIYKNYMELSSLENTRDILQRKVNLVNVFFLLLLLILRFLNGWS